MRLLTSVSYNAASSAAKYGKHAVSRSSRSVNAKVTAASLSTSRTSTGSCSSGVESCPNVSYSNKVGTRNTLWSPGIGSTISPSHNTNYDYDYGPIDTNRRRHHDRRNPQYRRFSSDGIPTLTASTTLDDSTKNDDGTEQLLAAALVTAREISALAAAERTRRLIASGTTGSNSIRPASGISPPNTTRENRWANVVSTGASTTTTGTLPPLAIDDDDDATNRNRNRNIRHEVQAAEALLALTSHPSFQTALIEHQRRPEQIRQTTSTDTGTANVDVATSLHSAFLSVISWICSTLSQIPPTANTTARTPDLSSSTVTSAESALLTRMLLNLHHRSLHLNLPLTLPLYKTLAGIIARHWDGADITATDTPNNNNNNNTHTTQGKHNLPTVLLDLSLQVRDTLRPTAPPAPPPSHSNGDAIITASFFSQPLTELLHQNRLRAMVDLLRGMRSVHGIEGVEIQAGMELLAELRRKVEEDHRWKKERRRRRTRESVAGGEEEGEEGLDEADAVELALMLQEPVMEALQMRKKEVVDYQQLVNSTIDDALLDVGVDDDDLLSGTEDENTNDDKDIGQPTSSAMIQSESDDAAEGGGIDSGDDYDNGEEMLFNISLDRDIAKLSELVKSTTEQNSTGSDGGEDDPLSSEDQKELKDAARAVIKKLRRTMQPPPNDTKGKDKLHDDNNNDDNIKNTPVPTALPNLSGLVARLHVNPSTGKIENIDFDYKDMTNPPAPSTAAQLRYDELHQEMLRDMCYVRDAHWQIPDVVSQLEEWNGERGLFFSKEFETDLMTNAQDEADFGGGRYFDDEHDYDDDDDDDDDF